MAPEKAARVAALTLWLVGGWLFGSAIGVGLFTEPATSWWKVAPWLIVAWLICWVGSLIPAMTDRPRVPLGSAVLALTFALAGAGAAILVADWWIADTRFNPRPDRGPILALWMICGGLGGLLAGFGAGWARRHQDSGRPRLLAAGSGALLSMALFAALGGAFLPLSYLLMQAPFQVPIPAIHHAALGWMVSGAAFGLLAGAISNRIEEELEPPTNTRRTT